MKGRTSGNRISASFQVAKHLLDLRHHLVGINVSHHNHSLVLGLIPALVEVTNGLGRTVLHHIHITNGRPVNITGRIEDFINDTHLISH